MNASGDPHRLAKLRWRSRRGMRELDALLMTYLEQDFPRATPEEQAAFERLLSFQDPVILDLLTGRIAADDGDLAHVVEKLLRAGGSAANRVHIAH
jgi:antitoxin CptB